MDRFYGTATPGWLSKTVKVYAEPSTASKVVAELTNGEIVHINREGPSGWYYANFPLREAEDSTVLLPHTHITGAASKVIDGAHGWVETPKVEIKNDWNYERVLQLRIDPIWPKEVRLEESQFLSKLQVK